MRILYVSSEIAPFAKTGGLADVAAAVPTHLARAGHDVVPVMPMYGDLRTKGLSFSPHARLQDVPVPLGSRTFHVSVSTAPLPGGGPDVHFLRCPELYQRPGIYGDGPDEHLRFALLARGALVIAQWLGEPVDVVHANDWHAALIPLYLRAFFAWDRLLAGAKTVLTIHNIGYQGLFGADAIGELGLADARKLLHQGDLREGRINFLKTGILYADALTTVSETYAREIQGEELGMGLHELLRARSESLVGILNGVDYEEWSPERDRWIPRRYSADDLDGKAENRSALLERMGIAPEGSDSLPLVGIVSRLVVQKGFDLLPEVLPAFLEQDALRLVVLGSGETRYEDFFAWLKGAYPGKVGFQPGYDERLAHLIEAGSDAFLMPSRYEPCGLNQMYSLRYGTVPIVRRTGGLADTVEPYDPERDAGTGFVFDSFSSGALYEAVDRCLRAFRDAAGWRRLVLRGMSRDFSWERQAGVYARLYERIASG